ncbi:MAG: MarR family transcriptional regulator [Chloroflexi bacterium]|nr:MAG: MarR family transcriptional regulator [Chloroflexota bacterium]
MSAGLSGTEVRNILASRTSQLDIDLVPMQMRALRTIWSSDNVTSHHIVTTLKRDKAQVARLVNELCARNLVYREPNPKDNRSKILKLTDEGNRIFQQLEDIEEVVFDEMVQGIDEEDLQTFFRVADQLSENMRQMK